MKAYVLEKYNAPFRFADVPDPACGDGDVVVRIKAAGVCGTDYKIYSGKLDGIIRLPRILGHEGAGEIVEVGRNVKTLKKGDRGIVYHYIPCRDCELCRTGRENVCLDIKRTGFELDGAFAEYLAVPEYNFCRVDGGEDWAKLAVLPDAVLTPYHALKAIGRISAGLKVLVVGLGGLGLHAVQIGKLFGAEMAGTDLRDQSLAEARKFGADLVFGAADERKEEILADWTEGKGVDVVLEGVGTNESFSWTLKSLKKGGRLVLMGYDPVRPLSLDALKMHYNEWEVLGARLGTKQELAELIELLGKGKLRPLISALLEMSEMNRVFGEALIASTVGRIVFKGLRQS